MEQIRDRILKLEQIEWRTLRDLQPADLKHVANSDHIRQSILKNGFAFPFAVWQDPAGEIYAIDGHTRKDVLQDMDNVPETLPAFFVDADNREDAIRILLEVYNQRHNEINPDVLTEWLEVEAIAVETVNVGSLHSAEVKETKTEVTEDEYDDTLPEHPETVLGDLYEIGPHRLLCGDSTDSDQVARLMNGEKADMVFTDPPYNINYGNIKHPKSKQREIENDNMDSGDFKDFCSSFISNIILFSKGCVYMAGPPGPDGRIMFMEADKVMHCSTVIVWNKDQFTLGRGKYQNKYEPIWFGWIDNGTSFYGDRSQTNVWDIPRPKKSEEHPTMKPVELVARAVNHASRKDDSCLDLFGGSGTSMVACDQLHRKCYGMELDPKYCDVIVKRLIKLNPSLTIKRNGEDVTEFWKEKAAQQ